jgi:hypothetical protein
MKMKKKAGATAAKTKTPAKKKPAAKAPAAKKTKAKPESRTSAAPAPETTKRTGTYTPSPVQGIGWAPFRYPPQ